MAVFFDGIVVHQRGGHVRHRLSQHVLSILVDVDEFEAEQRRGRWRFGPMGLLSLHLGDFGRRDGSDWREAVLDIFEKAGVSWVPSIIKLHAFPRFLGLWF
jgi:Uncharacterized conserved protein